MKPIHPNQIETNVQRNAAGHPLLGLIIRDNKEHNYVFNYEEMQRLLIQLVKAYNGTFPDKCPLAIIKSLEVTQ